MDIRTQFNRKNQCNQTRLIQKQPENMYPISQYIQQTEVPPSIL